MPGNLATQLKWEDRPIQLEFVITKDQLIIRQDGKELARTNFPLADKQHLQQGKVHWGTGIFGRLNGQIQQKSRK